MFNTNGKLNRSDFTLPKSRSIFDHPNMSVNLQKQQINWIILPSVRNSYQPVVNETSEEYWQCIGVIRSQWLSQKTKQVVKSICYGTAFVVASRFIITCAHNLYNDDDCTTADRCLFIPNHKGMVQDNTLVYHSAEGIYCRFIPLKKDQELSARPTPNEICLLVTQEDIVKKRYIAIGLCDIGQNEYIQAIGYPSAQFSAKPNLQEVNMKRRVEKGLVSSIRGSIEPGQFKTISYNLKTKKGMSGSPLLYNYKGKIVCVGIHTHGMKKGVKSGVFFNEFAVRTIKNFERQLADQYRLTSKIQYNITIEQSSKLQPTCKSSLIQSPDSDQISHISLEDQFQQFYNIIQGQISLTIDHKSPQIEIYLNLDDLIQCRNLIALSHRSSVLSK